MEPIHFLLERAVPPLLEESTALSARPEAPIRPDRQPRLARLRTVAARRWRSSDRRPETGRRVDHCTHRWLADGR
jgi:hypothetical protein